MTLFLPNTVYPRVFKPLPLNADWSNAPFCFYSSKVTKPVFSTSLWEDHGKVWFEFSFDRVWSWLTVSRICLIMWHKDRPNSFYVLKNNEKAQWRTFKWFIFHLPIPFLNCACHIISDLFFPPTPTPIDNRCWIGFEARFICLSVAWTYPHSGILHLPPNCANWVWAALPLASAQIPQLFLFKAETSERRPEGHKHDSRNIKRNRERCPVSF